MSSIEKTFSELKAQQLMMAGANRTGDRRLPFTEASKIVKEDIKDLIGKMIGEESKEDKYRPKKKSDLRTRKIQYEEMIRQVVYGNNFEVIGYRNLEQFVEEMVEEIVGYSVLAQAFEDNKVDDIFCLAWNKIYVERDGKNEIYGDRNQLVPAVDETGAPVYQYDEEGELMVDANGDYIPIKAPKPITFRDQQHYHDFIERVLDLTGKQVNHGQHKIVDAEFYEDRIAVTGSSVTPNDMSLTIRKHRESHLELPEIVGGGVLTEEVADLLGTIVLGELNLIYAGITGSGKTTTLRALLDYYVSRSNKRMLVVEDTQELFPQNPHTLELITSKTNDPNTSVDLRDLVMTALRLKPKHIIIGEVRGKEAEAAVEAMETGHATAFTMHGGTPWNIVNRLVNKYLMQMPSLSIDVVERIIGNSVDYIAIQDDIPHTGRRVTSITEVTYDFNNRRVVLVPIIEYDFETKDFVQVNKISPEKATMMMRRGLPVEVVKSLMREREDEFVESLSVYKQLSYADADDWDYAENVVIADYDDEEEDFF